MSDPRLHDTSAFLLETSSPPSDTQYRILRKGSRYNILGPQGRILAKYQSASKAGPRWEELMHTPWPYDSSAYERGHWLWELGLIERDQVGKSDIVVHHRPNNSAVGGQIRSRVGSNLHPKRPIKWLRITIPISRFALPAPKIDLEQHEYLMSALLQNPALLFTPQMQQALCHEVEYHRPQASWAAHLLKLLDRDERRQHRRQSSKTDSAITAKHVEWQAEQMQAAVAG